MANINTLDVTTNQNTWGQVTACVFFYDHRATSSGLYPLKIRITYKRERNYFKTGYSMSVDQWKSYNAGRGEVLKIRRSIQAQLDTIREHVVEMNEADNFSFELLNTKLGRGKKNDVFAAFEGRIRELKHADRLGNAVVYDCALNSIKSYSGTTELHFSKITKSWLESYEAAMTKKGNSTTTRSMYLRCLRAVLNNAGAAASFAKGTDRNKNKNKFQIKKGGGRKMALSRHEINVTLMKHPVLAGSVTEKMRDLFYFSYLASGINVSDMVSLEWGNIKNNEIHFVRHKTARTNSEERSIILPISPAMQTIIDRHGDTESNYIFGYINERMTAEQARVVIKNVIRLINKHLKILSKATGLPHISSYSARHSYASTMSKAKVPIEFISAQLGHSKITTTQNYLNGFDADERRNYNEALTKE